jgi:NHL repeat
LIGVDVNLKSLILLVLFISFSYGQTFTELGRFGGQGKEEGLFNDPLALAVSSDGIVYVVDTGNHRIQLFDLKGRYIRSIGGFGFNEDQFDSPHDIWVKSVINIYVSDYNNRRLQRYDRNMNFINSLSSNDGDDSDFQFFEVASCVVSSQNDLFILDHDEFKIIKFKRDGKAERSFGKFDSGEGELILPIQMDLFGADKILVSDSEQSAIIIFDLFGNFIQKIKFDSFKEPKGIGVDDTRNIYIADPVAGEVFFLKNDLQFITKIVFSTGFTMPRDVAVMTREGKTILFIIDGNEVLIGELTFPKSAGPIRKD